MGFIRSSWALTAAAALATASAETCDSSADAGCDFSFASNSSSSLSANETPTPTTSTPLATTATPTTTTTPIATTTFAPTTTTSASSTTTATPTTSTTSTSTSTSTDPSRDTSPSSSAASSANSSNASSSDASSSSSGASAITTSTGSSSSNTGLIIGVTGGVVMFLVLVIFICARIRRKKQTKNHEDTRTYRSITSPNRYYRADIAPPPSPPASRPPPPVSSQRTSELWEDPAIMVFRIPLDKVFVDSLVSQGGYGEVYRGTYKGDSVAIKKLQPNIRNDIKQINSFLAEAKILASIEHERLVRFVGVAWDSLRDLCVVTEFMEGGDLRSLLKQFEEKNRSQGFDADKTKIAMHVAHALTYLHSLQPIVIHRDLKSRNILLDNEWNAKLTDFGVARETSDQTMTAGVGTTLWMAPEIMLGERYNEKADIFSFGLVLTELDSHQMPYANAKNTNTGRTLPDTAVLQQVALGRLQAKFSPRAPTWLREMGAACLSLNPNDRPTAAELMYALQSK